MSTVNRVYPEDTTTKSKIVDTTTKSKIVDTTTKSKILKDIGKIPEETVIKSKKTKQPVTYNY
jgi:hypothetical protein